MVTGNRSMMDEQRLGRFLVLIEKLTNSVIKEPDYVKFREDVVQDVFLKLYRGDFFETHSLDSPDEAKQSTVYIKRTIMTCFQDQLMREGIYRKRAVSDVQDDDGETKYKQLEHQSMDDADNEFSLSSDDFSAEQILIAQQSYQIIKACFDGALVAVNDQTKHDFYRAVFWELDKYELSVKELAAYLGYQNSNPTQDFNRFVEKVSACTEKDGVKVVNPHEQVEFLKQILSLEEVA